MTDLARQLAAMVPGAPPDAPLPVQLAHLAAYIATAEAAAARLREVRAGAWWHNQPGRSEVIA